MISPVPEESVLLQRSTKGGMRRERMTSKTARYRALATVALLFLAAPLLAQAQTKELAQLHAAAATHPDPILAKLLAAANDAQPLKCQQVTLVPLLRKHYMPDVVGCIGDIVAGSFERADIGLAKPLLKREANDSTIGVVFDQDPPAGKKLMSDTQVTLHISKGPAPKGDGQKGDGRKPPPENNVTPVTAATVGQGPKKRAMTVVPPVRGFEEARALEIIKGKRLDPIAGGKEFSKEPVGSISRTDPPANQSVLLGAPVTYWMSLGPQPPLPPPPPPPPPPPHVAGVPSVTGMTPGEATEVLRKAGLVAGEPIAELSLAGTGRISRQEPLAGKPPPPPGQMVLLWRPYAWFSTVGVAAVSLLALGSAAGLMLRHLGAKRRLAYTREVLRIQPSLARDGETQLVRAIPQAGPALELRASLQAGEVHFAGPVSIDRQETQHD